MQSKNNHASMFARRLLYGLGFLLAGALMIGVIASAHSHANPKDEGPSPVLPWPEVREHLLPGLKKRWAEAAQQLAAGELSAAYASIIFGRHLLAPYLHDHGPDPMQAAAPEPTLQQFYDGWQKQFASALEQGFPAALRRLGEGREKLITVGLFQQAGFPQLAETVLKHKDEIIAARTAAAPTFLRVTLAGPASYHEILEKNLHAKFSPASDRVLIFEAPLSAAEEAATWRAFTCGVDEKVMRYFDGPDQKQPPLLALPSSVTLVWAVHPGPGPATTWDQPFTHSFTSGAPATLHVSKNFFGKITNQAEWPHPEPLARKLHAELNTWLGQNLSEFALKDPLHMSNAQQMDGSTSSVQNR